MAVVPILQPPPAPQTDQVAQQEQPQQEQQQPKEEEKMEEKKTHPLTTSNTLTHIQTHTNCRMKFRRGTTNHAEMATHTPLYPFRSLSTLGLHASSTKTRWLKVLLAADLKAEMVGMSFDKAMQHYVGQCQGEKDQTYVAPAEDEIYNATCVGIGYAYWALVHGTEGTKGNPYQCVNKGHCGYIFDWYK